MPSPGAGELVVRVATAGICRTDLLAAAGRIATRDPVVLGHELAGLVEACGAGVDLPLVRGFQGATVQRARVTEGELLVVRESTLRLDRGLLDQRWTYVAPDGRVHTRNGATRLYLPHELARLLREAGFGAVELFGDLDRSSVTLASPRCIALATRPA